MRVAIVNDLSLAREILRRVVLSVPGYSIAWEAADGDEAVDKALADRPDAILMDLVMPRRNGVEATREIMRRSPCPVVVTATIPGHYDMVMRAMGAGALDAVETPAAGVGGAILRSEPLFARLAKIEAAGRGAKTPGSGFAAVLHPNSGAALPGANHVPPLVLIGSSTGGPEALAAVLGELPTAFPAGVVIAQHIAADFGGGLVSWLAERCKLPVRAAIDGDTPTPGTVLVAVSNDHWEFSTDRKVRYTASPRGWPYRPVGRCPLRVGCGGLATPWYRGVAHRNGARWSRRTTPAESGWDGTPSRRTKQRAWSMGCRKPPRERGRRWKYYHFHASGLLWLPVC